MNRATPAQIQDLAKTPSASGIGVTGQTYIQATQEFLGHRLDFSIDDIGRGLADSESLREISHAAVGVYGEMAGSISPLTIIPTLNQLRISAGLLPLPSHFRVLTFRITDSKNEPAVTNYEVGE